MPVANQSHSTIFRRYAGAFLELAEEAKLSDKVARDMRGLLGVLRSSPELKSALSNPNYGKGDLSAVMQEILKKIDVQDLSRKLVLLLVAKRRLGLLEGIITAYLDELSARRGEVKAVVRTAMVLNAEEEDRLTAVLRNTAGKNVSVDIEVDTDLIGGFYVKLGSKMVDTSVKTQLATLANHMKGI